MPDKISNAEAQMHPELESDRRAEPRVEVAVLAAVLRNGEKEAAHVDNLAVSGCSLRGCTGAPLRIGDRLRLQIALPNLERVIQIDAVVRWVANGDPSSGGVLFAPTMSTADTQAIIAYSASTRGE